MRLTNEMRNTFVNAVMAAIKLKVKHTETSITEELGKRLNASLPQEVQDFAKKYPQHVSFTSTCVDFMRYRKSAEGRTWFVYPKANHIHGPKLLDVKFSDMEKAWEARQKEDEERASMKSRLLDIAMSATTTEALEKLLPDLVKFIPKPAVNVKSLPVAQKGILTELKKMGLGV